MRKNQIRLEGRRFGSLTVLREIPLFKNRKRWEVHCDCGTTFPISGARLLSGGQESHKGCPFYTQYQAPRKNPKARTSKPRNDLSGLRTGRLTVTRCLMKQKNGVFLWEAKCDCGKILVRPTGAFTSAKSPRTHCGCKPRAAGPASPKWKGRGTMPGFYWAHVLAAARTRHLCVEITIDSVWDLFEKQGRRCAITGVEIGFSSSGTRGTASLDRIDSTKGYVPGNTQWIHKTVNKMKNNIDQAEFLEWCSKITKYQSN